MGNVGTINSKKISRLQTLKRNTFSPFSLFIQYASTFFKKLGGCGSTVK